MFNKSFLYGALAATVVVYAYHHFVHPLPAPAMKP